MPARKKDKATIKKGFWDQLPDSRKHVLSLVFLLILPFILFYSTTLGGKQYMGNDAIQWRAGAETLIEHREQYDEVAHWASNMFSGMPANTISHPPQITNLDNTLLKLFEFIYPAVEYWILLGGAYLMFLLLGLRPLTSVFGAVVVGFSTYIPIIIGAGHNAKFLAYIYIPWIYAGYFLITRSNLNRWLAFFIFALAVTLHLRSYHPQVTYFFLFPLATLFFYDAVSFLNKKKLNDFIRHSSLIFGASLIALLITVQLYWSTAEYSEFSMRGGSEIENTDGLSQDYAFSWSQGIGELLTLAIPGSYGGASGDSYWGPKPFTSGPHYMGALAVLFFIIGLIRSKHELKWVFAGPGIATLLFSLGEHFSLLNSFMFNYFPLFDKFRVPEMWLMTTVFCFAVVALLGLELVVSEIEKKSATWKKSLGIGAAAGLLFMIIGFQALDFQKPGERAQIAEQVAQQNQVSVDDPRVRQVVNNYINKQLVPARRDLAKGDTLRFGFFIVAGLGLFWIAGMGKLPLSVALVALPVLTAVDMIGIDMRYHSENSLVDKSLSIEQVIRQSSNESDRFISDNVTHEEGWKYRALPLLSNPFNNAVPSYHYPSAGGYSGAKLGYYQDMIDRAFFNGPAGLNIPVLSMLNIKYLTLGGSPGSAGLETVFETERGVVLENSSVLPKAWFVDKVVALNSQPDVLNQITGVFDPAATAYIAERAGITVQPDTAASVNVTTYNANRIELDITRSEPGFLVLSEIWYPPGWQASLNGNPVDIIRTNYVLRGFEIPAGESKLVLELEPAWYLPSYWMSVIGTLLLFGSGAAGLFFYLRHRKQAGQ